MSSRPGDGEIHRDGSRCEANTRFANLVTFPASSTSSPRPVSSGGESRQLFLHGGEIGATALFLALPVLCLLGVSFGVLLYLAFVA